MRTQPNGSKRNYVIALAAGACIGGCNVDGNWTDQTELARPAAFQDSDAGRSGVDMAVVDQGEVDLVENVVGHRDQYIESLHRLERYYAGQGHDAKRRWAEMEFNGIMGVKRFRYVMDAEVPAGSLTANEPIAEADELFARGMDLMRRGGHGVPAVYRRDRMVEAAEVFRELIERFPNSDKIDDAAFYCGEIHKDYLPGQEGIAVAWYERAWTWDPNTPHPAKFQAAVVYDYRLHDRDRALELYQAVVADTGADAGNARFAARRIRELTGLASAGQP